MKNNFIFLSTHLITNFKPKILKNFNKLNFFKKNKKQIFCKNFFLFLLLLKFKKHTIFSKSTIFIKPYKKKIYTILRSPYRHKLTRHQLVLNRYEIVSSIKIKIENKIIISNFVNFLKLFNTLSKYNLWFESNIISNHKFKFQCNLFYKNNFKLSLFNNNK